MTRKRLRYSELAVPAPTPPAEPSLPVAEPAPEAVGGGEPVADAIADALQVSADEHANAPVQFDSLDFVHDDESPLFDATKVEGATIEAPVPLRARRDSTPVELARTLTAERAAARARDGDAADDSGDWSSQPVAEPGLEPQRTLRERARAKEGSAELLMFRVGGERFAVELILVDEVIDLPVIHYVPEMPPAMLGVVTVRGSLTPVYSPLHALGLALAQRDAVLIFRRGAHRVGILIDDVDDALTVDLRELREKPAGEDGDNVLLGVIRLDSALVGIVDTDALIVSCQSANILEPA